MKAGSSSLHFVQVVSRFSFCFWGCVVFLLFKSCPTVQRPHNEGCRPVRTQSWGSDSSFYPAARSDATRVPIAAVYFASTCRCLNERALGSLQPNCAFNGTGCFALCCFSAAMESGAHGALGGHENPRGALAPGWGCTRSACALGSSKGIIAQERLVSKEGFVNRVHFVDVLRGMTLTHHTRQGW